MVWSTRKSVVLLILVAAALRLPALGVFPEVAADEGLWTNSTKNFLLFGDWFMDGRKHMLLSPAFHAASLVSFALTSPSIAHARAISAIAGVASVALLYLLTLRLTADRMLAVLTAFLLATTHFFVLMSRTALIEASELCCVLAALVVLTEDGRWRTVVGGLLLGTAALFKINILFLVPIVGLLLANRSPAGWRAAALRFGAVTVIALATAAAVYGALYFAYPVAFRQAFIFELDGKHFEAGSHPIVRVGRFGFDPWQAAQTAIALVTAEPVLIPLAVLGFAIVLRKPRGPALLFATWCGMGSAYFVSQMYQPVRYFYLIAPALCFLAALAIIRLSTNANGRVITARLAYAAALYAAFSVAYLGLGAAMHRGRMLEAVNAWARTTDRSENVMASAYLCTDLPNRAYGQYLLAGNPGQLVDSIRRYNIKYVVFDSEEWSPAVGDYLKTHFPQVVHWPFGAVFDVTAAANALQPAPTVVTDRSLSVQHHD